MDFRRKRRAGLLAALLGVAWLGGSSAWAWRAGSGGAQEPFFQISPTAPAGETGEEVRGRRPVRGKIDFGRIPKGFSDATIVLTLRRSAIPNSTSPSNKVAEVRYFGVSWVPGESAFPFTLGDFAAVPGTNYSLECFVDVNRSGRMDAGDYWNQRQVRVLSPESPASAMIQDFEPILEAR